MLASPSTILNPKAETGTQRHSEPQLDEGSAPPVHLGLGEESW